MRHENAAARVRRRIADWVKEKGHGSRKRLAEAVHALYGAPRSQSWITDLTDGPDKGGQDLRLRDLDALASAMGLPPGDLVKREDDHYVEVTSAEMRILRYYRMMPDAIRHQWVACLDYLYSFQERALAEQSAERDRRTQEARVAQITRRKA